MGTSTRFNAANPLWLQNSSPRQKLGIFLGIDVIGHNSQLEAVAEPTAESLNQSRFAGTHRSGNPQTQLARHQLRNRREYSSAWASCVREAPTPELHIC